jgi:hypothetical protein
MAKAVTSRKAKGGRAASGRDPLATRLPPSLRKAVATWAKDQDDQPGRAEAIRRLVEIGLATSARPLARSEKNAAKAKQLAAKAIDRLLDPAAPAEQQASRKRRLLRGPEEFRELRVDRSKPKGGA